MGIFLIIVSYILTKMILVPIAGLLSANGATRENYLGKQIPIAMGLVIWLGIMPSFLIYEHVNLQNNYLLYMLIMTITLFIGFIDDLLGNHKVKGLKGHLLKLIKANQLTSGALKALVISIISLFFTLKISDDIFQCFLNFVILILTTNSFNLLDIRPGRAIKVYLLIAFIFLLIYPQSRYFIGIFMASILAYAPWDFKGKAMLGDTGSNLLGMTIGLVLITNLQLLAKIIALLILIFLHIFTEYRSLTEVIENNNILRLLDNLGR